MDRNQKWMLGLTSLCLATSLSIALFLSENKHAKRMMHDMMYEVKHKM